MLCDYRVSSKLCCCFQGYLLTFEIETDSGLICLPKTDAIVQLFCIHRVYALKAVLNKLERHLIELIIMNKSIKELFVVFTPGDLL